VFFLLNSVCQRALAWDGNVTGTIFTLDVTDGDNYGLRVTLNSGATLCNGGGNIAYLNETDSNYNLYAAALLMARAQNMTVTLYTNLVGGQCKIGYLSINPG
jgi:hypothetical protein